MTGTSKAKYTALCEREPSIPLFSQAWWLDCVCGPENWDVALVEKGQRIEAALPYILSKKAGFTVCGMPKLTQSLGPWLTPSTAKYSKQLGRQKDLLTQLIDALPPYDHFVQGWHTSQQNWLPFYWRGFQQTTRYTYVLQNISDTDALWKNMQDKVRNDIRKAENRFHLKVHQTDDLHALFRLNQKTFSRQNKTQPYTFEFLERVDHAAKAKGLRSIYIAKDEDGQDHAAVYIVRDQQCAHYLISGSDPELRHSGANTLALWAAIQDSAKYVDQFNFEGSMIEPIESSFRAFGGTQMPYFQLSHTPSKMLRTAFFLRDLIKI